MWCDLRGMKFNASNIKQFIPSESGRSVLKESSDLVILGVMFYAKMAFENTFALFLKLQLSQRLGITRKSWQVFHDRSLLLRSFWCFVLPVLEYCSAVWCSGAYSHLKLLDTVVRCASFWTATLPLDDLWQCYACYLKQRITRQFLCRMCRCLLFVLLWLLIYICRHSFAHPRCLELLTGVGPLWPSQCLCGTLLMTLCLMVWD